MWTPFPADSHGTISRRSVDSSRPAAMHPDPMFSWMEVPDHRSFFPFAPISTSSLWDLRMERVSGSQKREPILTSLWKKKKKSIYGGLASSEEPVRTMLSTSEFHACPCLSEASDSFSWDLATSKGAADII